MADIKFVVQPPDTRIVAAISVAVAAFLDLERQPSMAMTTAWSRAERPDKGAESAKWPNGRLTWSEAERTR